MRSSIQFNNPHDAENIKTKYPESISYLNPDRNNEIWISNLWGIQAGENGTSLKWMKSSPKSNPWT